MRGGWRGGVRPSVWEDNSDMTTFGRIPRRLKKDLKAIAHLLDKGDVTLQEIQKLALK